MSGPHCELPSRQEILDKIRDVAAIPVASIRVMRLLQNPDFETDALVQCIEYDPGLTSSVLRMANSALLGGVRNVASVREAVLRLGARRITQVVMTAAVGPHLRPAERGYDLSAEALWRHAVATALGAETLAARADMLAPPYTFTAGLLHNIGKTVLAGQVGVDAAPIVALAEGEKIPFEAAERRLLGIDHAELGGLLLEQWSLPVEIVEVVRAHHAPGALGESNVAVDLVHLADILGTMSVVGTGRNGPAFRASRETLARIPLTKPLVARVIADTRAEMEALASMFELN